LKLEDMTREQLAGEVSQLRQRVAELEAQEANHTEVEQALMKSERLYSLLANNITDVIWTVDANLRYIYISPSVEHQRGYTAAEIESHSLSDTLTADSYDLTRRIFEEEAAEARRSRSDSPRSRVLVLQLKRKDGSLFWAEVEATLLFDKECRLVSILGVSRDIDKRKRAEEETRGLLRRQQALLENVPAFIFLKDAQMRYTAVNRAYMEMLPEDIEDPLGRRDRNFYPAKLAMRFEAEDRQVLEEGKTIRKEEPIRLRDRRTIQTAVSITPVHAKDGAITGMVGIAFDITERKDAEEKLKRYTAELRKANEEQARLMEKVRALSLTDELTGLHNRRGFLSLAEQQVKIANRTKGALSLFYFDLDNMKKINDTLGHREGDHALRETAYVLGNTFRDSDIIARIGGDEFAVMAIESSENSAEAFVNRLGEHLRELNSGGARSYDLSLSVGVAHYEPEKPCTIDELLAQADSLMYKHKRAKRSP